jgi:nucleotide-binding universal stress UspA family protein
MTARSIVAAVDFGNASARAVTAAGAIAERCGTTSLELLHAETFAAPPYFTRDQVDMLERQRDAARAAAERFVASFGRQHTREPFAVSVQNREAVEAILREGRRADLMVMGTHGRHGAKRWWLGSVAERVLESIETPLLVVPEAAAQRHVFERLLVHAPAAASGGAALHYATQLGRCFDAVVIDGRGRPLAAAVRDADPTCIVIEAPLPRPPHWLSDYGRHLVEFCRVPMLFVPERTIQEKP